jgi:hypothetical protein
MADISDLEVRDQLKRRLDLAYARYREAIACFRSAFQEERTLPVDDGAAQMHVSGRRLLAALQGFSAAFNRFAEFTLNHSAVRKFEGARETRGSGPRSPIDNSVPVL